jgi:hypothetical protein
MLSFSYCSVYLFNCGRNSTMSNVDRSHSIVLHFRSLTICHSYYHSLCRSHYHLTRSQGNVYVLLLSLENAVEKWIRRLAISHSSTSVSRMFKYRVQAYKPSNPVFLSFCHIFGAFERQTRMPLLHLTVQIYDDAYWKSVAAKERNEFLFPILGWPSIK